MEAMLKAYTIVLIVVFLCPASLSGDELLQRAVKTGSVFVDVNLDIEYQYDLKSLTAEQFVHQMHRVERELREFTGPLIKKGILKEDRIKYGPATNILVEVDAEGLQALMAHPLVRRVSDAAPR